MMKKIMLRSKEGYSTERFLRKINFNWYMRIGDYVEMEEETRLYYWLYPIRFNAVYAAILEMIQNCLILISEDRKEAFELMADDLNISVDLFNKYISEIQKILIKYKKAKICANGQVLIMDANW